MLFNHLLEIDLLKLPNSPLAKPQLFDVWEKYRQEGVKYLDSVELTPKRVEELFTNQHYISKIILLDSDFMVELDRRVKSSHIRELKHEFVERLIKSKVKKADIVQYLRSLFEARLQGKLDTTLQEQLYKLDLVPFKDKFPPEYLDAWHGSVFKLTFRHDIFENKDAHW